MSKNVIIFGATVIFWPTALLFLLTYSHDVRLGRKFLKSSFWWHLWQRWQFFEKGIIYTCPAKPYLLEKAEDFTFFAYFLKNVV